MPNLQVCPPPLFSILWIKVFVKYQRPLFCVCVCLRVCTKDIGMATTIALNHGSLTLPPQTMNERKGHYAVYACKPVCLWQFEWPCSGDVYGFRTCIVISVAYVFIWAYYEICTHWSLSYISRNESCMHCVTEEIIQLFSISFSYC